MLLPVSAYACYVSGTSSALVEKKDYKKYKCYFRVMEPYSIWFRVMVGRDLGACNDRERCNFGQHYFLVYVMESNVSK